MTVREVLAEYEAQSAARKAEKRPTPPPPVMPWPGKYIGAAAVWVRPEGAA